MRLALKEAMKAYEDDEVPVGAVLVIDDKVVSRGRNKKEHKLDVTSHAEIECLRNAAKKKNSYLLNTATLYVTLEPCIMCCGAIKDSRIKRIVFGAKDKEKGAIVSNYGIFDDPKMGKSPLITQGILSEECSKILKNYFQLKRK